MLIFNEVKTVEVYFQERVQQQNSISVGLPNSISQVVQSALFRQWLSKRWKFWKLILLLGERGEKAALELQVAIQNFPLEALRICYNYHQSSTRGTITGEIKFHSINYSFNLNCEHIKREKKATTRNKTSWEDDCCETQLSFSHTICLPLTALFAVSRTHLLVMNLAHEIIKWSHSYLVVLITCSSCCRYRYLILHHRKLQHQKNTVSSVGKSRSFELESNMLSSYE